MAALGRVYYSFDLEKIHSIVVDNTKNINENAKINYMVKIADRYLAWLRGVSP